MNLALVPEQPHATRTLDAERSILSAALTGDRIAAEAIATLSEHDFYQPSHAAVWVACMTVIGRGDRIEPTLLPVPTRAHHVLMDLMTTESSPVLSHQYAAKIIDAAYRRRLHDAADQVRRLADTADDGKVAAEESRKVIDEVVAHTVTTEAGVGVSALIDETIDALESPDSAGISTGWHDLDQIARLRPGQLCVIGARPAVGKSVLATNIAANACKAGVGVHFASLEMTRREVMSRMLADTASVDLGRVIDHKLTEGDWERIGRKQGDMSGWPLWVDDTPAQTLLQLRSRARSTSRRFDLGLIVVDYMQLMAPRDRRAPREQQVGENSEGLKVLAKELGVPIVALAQVNRGPADRRDSRPSMSDLRESGRIEADADHVWLLHREDLVKADSTTGILELHVAKNRSGPAGSTVELSFMGHHSRAASRAWSPSAGLA